MTAASATTSQASGGRAAPTVAKCTPDDMAECVAAIADSFGRDAPFINMYYPALHTPAGQSQAAARFCDMMLAEEEEAAVSASPAPTTFLKAVIVDDNDSDKDNDKVSSSRHRRIAGFAIWSHMTPARNVPARLEDSGEDVAAIWGPDAVHGAGGADEVRFMAQLWASYSAPRRAAVAEATGNADAGAGGAGEGLMVLEMLAVRGDCQRRGVGSALVGWGTKEADRLGVASVVESTQAGRRAYEKFGFQAELQCIPFDAIDADLKATRKLPHLSFMRRDKK